MRKLLGGGMRQAGVLAAAGLVALETHGRAPGRGPRERAAARARRSRAAAASRVAPVADEHRRGDARGPQRPRRRGARSREQRRARERDGRAHAAAGHAPRRRRAPTASAPAQVLEQRARLSALPRARCRRPPLRVAALFGGNRLIDDATDERDCSSVATRRGLTEITGAVRAAVRASGVREGLCTVFIRHTSASLVIQENADPAVRRDLEAFLSRLVQDGDPALHPRRRGRRRHAAAREGRAAQDLGAGAGRRTASWRSAPGRGSTSGSTAAARTAGRSRCTCSGE